MFDEARRWEAYSQVLTSKDIRLSYSANASTASYDLMSQEVVLPMWDCLDEASTQALTSHEIGHAKFSDYDIASFKEFFERYKDLFNVVEDARIERLMKSEFPGLNEIFKDGYATLASSGIFPLDGIEKASLIERLNVFAKFGFMVEVPFFNKEESEFAYRIMNLATKADVIDLCEDVYSYLKDRKESLEDSIQDMSFSEGEMSESSQDNESSNEPDNDSKDAGQMEFSNEKEGEDGSESSEKLKENESEGDKKQFISGQDGGDPLNRLLEDGRTRQFAKSLEETFIKERNSKKNAKVIVLRSQDVLQASYMELDIESIKAVSEKCRKPRNYKWMMELIEKSASEAASLFAQKKSALENTFKRRMHTGRLDLKKLAKHSVTDAIFRTVEKLPKGKSHGIVLLLDFSLSMGRNKDIQRCACLQAAILGRFCQLVGIEFSIIAFGCDVSGSWNHNSTKSVVKIGDSKFFDVGFIISLAELRLNSSIHLRNSDDEWINFSLGGCTPTIEGLIAARKEVKQMRARGIEKAAIIVSTDGGYSAMVRSGNEEITDIEYVHRILLDGKAFEVSDLHGMEKKCIDHTSDWGFELFAGYIKKETGASFIFSSIADTYAFKMSYNIWKCVEDDARNGRHSENGHQGFEPYIFKRLHLLGKPLNSIDFSKMYSTACWSIALDGDQLIDNYLTMNSSNMFFKRTNQKDFENCSSDDIVSKLGATNKALGACKAFAKAFVEFFS